MSEPSGIQMHGELLEAMRKLTLALAAGTIGPDRMEGELLEAMRKLTLALATTGIGPDHPDGGKILEEFIRRCRSMDKPRVLELGTKRAIPDQSTRHDVWIPNAGEYLGTDIEKGIDVDIVADVYRLPEVVGEEQFDVVISCSTFEHFKYPHLAAHQILKVLKVGGVLYIQTHQTFPIHSYPSDYFRFSQDALAGLFGMEMGFRVIKTIYEFPVRLYSRRDHLTLAAEAFLNVALLGEKLTKTPRDYIFDI
jgi:SAM-dependent methyltransferase